ncbi:hypothetical protein AGMMS49921_10240 [Endomicrobiia bacterium]|nr:hypothetical protein AGMMS49921_10240 [Endomicrobiia bacterium]
MGSADGRTGKSAGKSTIEKRTTAETRCSKSRKEYSKHWRQCRKRWQRRKRGKKMEEIQVAKMSARGVEIALEALLKRVEDYSGV